LSTDYYISAFRSKSTDFRVKFERKLAIWRIRVAYGIVAWEMGMRFGAASGRESGA
jgi:hypothetical protein